jgi:hypothetical protein
LVAFDQLPHITTTLLLAWHWRGVTTDWHRCFGEVSQRCTLHLKVLVESITQSNRFLWPDRSGAGFPDQLDLQ